MQTYINGKWCGVSSQPGYALVGLKDGYIWTPSARLTYGLVIQYFESEYGQKWRNHIRRKDRLWTIEAVTITVARGGVYAEGWLAG